MDKNLLGWAVLTMWILTWCSSNNTVNEGNEIVKDSITIIKDSVNSTLIEVVDQDTHDYIQRKRLSGYDKIPLEDSKVEGKNKEKKDMVNAGVNDKIRMYEAWIDDWDEMIEYMKQSHKYSSCYPNWESIIYDSEWEGSYEVNGSDPEDDLKFKGKIK